jgi:hypothetical protein
VLTTQALIREIASLRELLETRLSGIETLYADKFHHIEQRFSERDVVAADRALAVKDAVDTAFEGAKEAAAKSETSFSKMIDSQGELLRSTTNALDGKIGDLKDRVGLIEGRGSGFATSWAVGVALVGMMVGIGGVVVVLLSR